MTKIHLYPSDGEAVIYLLDCKRCIRQFKMSGSSGIRLSWVVLWTIETSRCFFVAFLIVPLQCWFINALILSVGQWFNARTVLRSGNFRAYGWTGFLFDPMQSFLFLSNQQLLNFQFYFSFPDANCWASLARFSQLSFGELSLWPYKRFHCCCLLLRKEFLAEVSARRFPFSFQRVKFRMPWDLNSSENVASWAYGRFLILFQLEVRKPCCFHNIPKSWTNPKATLLSVEMCPWLGCRPCWAVLSQRQRGHFSYFKGCWCCLSSMVFAI